VVAPPPLVAVQPPPPVPVQPAPRRWLTSTRVAGIVVGGAGLVGLGVGAGFGASAISSNNASKANGNCNAQSFCNATGKADRLDAIHAATASTIGFVAGGVALAGGVVLIVAGKPRARSTGGPAAGPAAAIVLGPGDVGLAGRW
jgi:hypothetical protein